MAALQPVTTEAQLISELKKGAYRAFDSIYQMYARRIYAYCLQFARCPEDAEEIVQDVFVKLWTHREHIRQEETLRSLLFIMARHQLINIFRSEINRPVYEEWVNYKEEIAEGDASEQLEYQEFVASFKQAMQTLPATQRKVIVLSRIQELSNKEIASQLALSEQTVKNALSTGLKKLKTALNMVLTGK